MSTESHVEFYLRQAKESKTNAWVAGIFSCILGALVYYVRDSAFVILATIAIICSLVAVVVCYRSYRNDIKEAWRLAYEEVDENVAARRRRSRL